MGWHLRYHDCTSKYSHLGTSASCPCSLKPGSILKRRGRPGPHRGAHSPLEVPMLPQGTEDWWLKPVCPRLWCTFGTRVCQLSLFSSVSVLHFWLFCPLAL